ncbi:MAG: gliding motility-associated C-terminal domain-containing protein [Allomuricauda sp.]
MFFTSISAKKRNSALLSCVLFSLVFINTNAHITSYDPPMDSDVNPDYNEVYSNGMYLPIISLIKTGTVSLDCSQIRFNFQVANQSTAGEVLENVVITDPALGGIVAGVFSGDINNNGLLEIGETWEIEAVYDITQVDLNNGQFINQANVQADVQGQPGVTVNDLSDNDSFFEDEPTITDLSSCQAGISVIKTGVAIAGIDAGPGCNFIIYEFEVANQGPTILENVVLNDPSLGGDIAGPDSGDVNNNTFLDPGEIWIYSAIYVITNADISNGEVVNQATVTADIQGQLGATTQDLSDDNSILEDDVTVIDLSSCQPRIAVVKTGIALEGIEAGPGCNLILYEFTVTNEGPEILENIVLNDPLLGGDIPGPVSGDDNNDGFLDLNEAWIYSAAYNTLQSDIDNGFVENQATVTADVQGQPGETVQDLSDNDSVLEDDPTKVDLSFCLGADIGLIKQGTVVDIDGDGCLESILYTFTLTNTGTVDIDEIVLEDELLGGEVPGPVEGTDVNDDGILSVGETWTYEAIYAITQEDIDNATVINQAEVNGEIVNSNTAVFDLSHDANLDEDGPTRTPVPDDACTEGSADIGLIKVGTVIDIDGDGCLDSILYTFTLTNTGGADIDEITLEDNLLGGEVPGPIDGSDINDDGILSAGETWTYEAIYAITQQDIDNAAVINQAEVNGEIVNTGIVVSDLSHDANLDEDGPTRTPVPNDACTEGSATMGLIKQGSVVDLDGDGCLDSILYTFTLTNTGDVDIDEITLEDELLGGEVPGPLDGTDINNDGILSVGETWTYEAIYAITQEDIDNAAVVNQAKVNGEIVDTEISVTDNSHDANLDEDGPTRTPVPDDACTNGSADMGLIKVGEVVDIDGDGCIESILYTFTLTNTGGVDIDEITLEDQLLDGAVPGPLDGTDNGNDGILSVGETWTYEAVYAITQEDIDNSIVVNQALVNGEIVTTEISVSDLSHDINLNDDGPTRTEVPNDACTEGSASIGLIKEGIAADVDGDGCVESIRYTFTLTNLGDTDLAQVSLEDDLLSGNIPGPASESIDENGILQVGEVWTYIGLYPITEQDIINGSVINQAIVFAEPVGTNNQVADFSDDDSNLENDPTRTPVPNDACPGDGGNGTLLFGIAVIKTGVSIDNDFDGCDDSIDYNFSVTNTGSINLDNVILNDELLGGTINGLLESIETVDNILQPGEEWIYTATYNLTQEDIDGIFVDNQATVTADLEDSTDAVFDNSDDNSYLENDITSINVSSLCEFSGGGSDFQIFNGMTPNGDGLNDYFRIQGIENYPDNNVKIFNRWGVQVYQIDSYGQGNNLFYGISKGRATLQKDRELPSGTYFYILTFTGENNPGKESYSGYLYINRD